ncbi:MAG TPA: hypothetical protein VEU51_13805 [Candidatus Acidoferrales bacterium]|nr:hypothetical protein [Candidatus Acidoferrales bacterium]
MRPETTATLGHIFAIRAIEKLPGLFKPRRYLYHCARCKWSFIVNDGRRGLITAVSDKFTALDHDEAARRVATFATGPCPALEILTHAPIRANGSNGAAPVRADRRQRPGVHV